MVCVMCAVLSAAALNTAHITHSHVGTVSVGTPLGQSVEGLLRAARSNFRSVRGRGKDFHLFEVSRSDLGRTQPPTQWVQRALSLAGNATGT